MDYPTLKGMHIVEFCSGSGSTYAAVEAREDAAEEAIIEVASQEMNDEPYMDKRNRCAVVYRRGEVFNDGRSPGECHAMVRHLAEHGSTHTPADVWR